jgi:hypothetical protein
MQQSPQADRAQRIFEANVDAMAAPSFMNETDRAVHLATWTTVMPGLSEYLHATVAPGESCPLPPSIPAGTRVRRVQ